MPQVSLVAVRPVESHVYSFEHFLYQTFVFPQHSHRLVALKLCFARLHVTLVVLEGWIATELLEGLTDIDETC